MVQVLKPGAAAEICRMPDGAEDLNGMRGVVVSYNGSNGRYTFEIDDRDEIVSLKAKNLKKVVASGAEEERAPKDASRATDTTEQTSSEDASPPSEVLFQFNDLVKYRRPNNGQESRALVTGLRYLDDEPIYTIRLLSNNVEKNTKADSLTLLFRGEPAARDNGHQGPNWFQQVGKRIAETNATTIIIVLLAILVLWSSGTTSHSGSPDYYPSYSGWWASHWHWSWGWGWVGGLGSVLFVSFYARKLGTHNGRSNFSWNRLWQKLMEMDFWELVRLAALMESALAFVAMAGRRRR